MKTITLDMGDFGLIQCDGTNTVCYLPVKVRITDGLVVVNLCLYHAKKYINDVIDLTTGE